MTLTVKISDLNRHSASSDKKCHPNPSLEGRGNIRSMIRIPRAKRIARASALLAQDGAKVGEVAKVLGVSRKTLYQVMELINQESVAKELLAYRSTLRSDYPVPERAKHLVSIAKGEAGVGEKGPNPFAMIKALQRIDALSGIHAEPPRDSTQHTEPVPLFSLPPGTRVAIQVGKPDED